MLMLLLLEYLLEINVVFRPKQDFKRPVSVKICDVTPVVVVVEAARCPDARPTAAAVACRGQDDE